LLLAGTCYHRVQVPWLSDLLAGSPTFFGAKLGGSGDFILFFPAK
jgi:hypothetical protein